MARAVLPRAALFGKKSPIYASPISHRISTRSKISCILPEKNGCRNSLQLQKLHDELFDWWREHGRVLPWREKVGEKTVIEGDLAQGELRERSFKTYFANSLYRDLYKVIVAELM